MVKKAVLAVVFLMGAIVFAQDTNKMDANGKRNGLWKGVYEKTNRVRYEGTFDHGKETGTFKFFEDDAASSLMATRVFAKDGSCYTTFLDPKGNKVSEGKEVNHLPEGEWKYYHLKSKAVMSIEKYKDGKLTGMRKVFYEKGAIAEETTYADGVKQGPYKKYSEKGVVLEEVTYVNGNYQGQATYRDTNGNIVSQGNYKDGLKSGNWKFFADGKLSKEQNMDVSARKAAGKAKAKPKASN